MPIKLYNISGNNIVIKKCKNFFNYPCFSINFFLVKVYYLYTVITTCKVSVQLGDNYEIYFVI